MKPKRAPDPMHPRSVSESGRKNHACVAVASEPTTPTCGAKTRSGAPCRNLPMKNGRCRMHGGASTGPKTAGGLARWRQAVTIHGGRSKEMAEFRRQMRELRAEARRLVEAV